MQHSSSTARVRRVRGVFVVVNANILACDSRSVRHTHGDTIAGLAASIPYRADTNRANIGQFRSAHAARAATARHPDGHNPT